MPLPFLLWSFCGIFFLILRVPFIFIYFFLSHRSQNILLRLLDCSMCESVSVEWILPTLFSLPFSSSFPFSNHELVHMHRIDEYAAVVVFIVFVIIAHRLCCQTKYVRPYWWCCSLGYLQQCNTILTRLYIYLCVESNKMDRNWVRRRHPTFTT